MKCVICHSDNIEQEEVRESFAIGDDLVYMLVKALVCQTCGERYYDRATMKLMEEAEKKLREGEAELKQVGKVLLYS